MSEQQTINVVSDLAAFDIKVLSDDVVYQLTIPIEAFEISATEIAKRSMVAAWMGRAGFMYGLAKKHLTVKKAELEHFMAEEISNQVTKHGAKNEWSAKAEYRKSQDFLDRNAAIGDAENTLALLEKLIESLKEKSGEMRARVFQAGNEYRGAADVGRSGFVSGDLSDTSTVGEKAENNVDGKSVEEYNRDRNS